MNIAQVYFNSQNNVDSTRSSEQFATLSKNDAMQFQEMLRTEFNALSKMTPSEIMSRISQAKSSPGVYRIEDVVLLSSGISMVDGAISRQEKAIKTSIQGKGSLQELMSSVNEATTLVKTFSTLRNQFTQTLEKIMNMQI